MSVRAMPAPRVGRTVGSDSIVASEARSARAFAAARRHTWLVRGLRAVFIVGAVGAVAVLTALGLYRTFGAALGRLSIGEVSIDGTKIAMDRPRLTGARADGGSYVIDAAKAIQDIKHPTEVELVAIEGDIVPADHDTLHLTATSGHYDSARESLDLAGVVQLKNNSYTVDLSSAHIDFKSGAYASQAPVTVVTASGASIVADSAQVRDNGKEIMFDGHVRSIIRPNSGNLGAAELIKGGQP
jgi:lipopolysaccharide export system protein LptC